MGRGGCGEGGRGERRCSSGRFSLARSRRLRETWVVGVVGGGQGGRILGGSSRWVEGLVAGGWEGGQGLGGSSRDRGQGGAGR